MSRDIFFSENESSDYWRKKTGLELFVNHFVANEGEVLPCKYFISDNIPTR